MISIILFLLGLTPVQTQMVSDAKLLFQRSEDFAQSAQLDSAIFYNKLAIKELTISGQKQSAKYLRALGIHLKNVGRIDTSLIVLEHARAVFEANADTLGLANVYRNLGISHARNRSLDLSIEFYTKSQELGKLLGDKDIALKASIAMGNIYTGIHEYSQAKSLYLDALSLSSSDKEFIKTEALVLMNLGVVHSYRYQQISRDTIDNREFDPKKSLQYYQESLIIYQGLNDLPNQINVRFNIGHLSNELGEYVRAEQIYKEVIESWQSINARKDLLLGYLSLGNLYLLQKSLEAAHRTFMSFYAIAVDLNDKPMLRTVYLKLAILEEELGNLPMALEYRKNYRKLDDELFQIDKEKAFQGLKIKYETDKLIDDLANSELSNRLKTNTQILTSLASVFIISLLFIRYFSSRKLAEKNKNLYDREINQLITTQELKLVQTMLDTQDNERMRIAADLHDRLGSTLSATSMHVDGLDESMMEPIVEKTSKIKGLLDKAIKETQEIAYNMQSMTLVKFGLKAALDDLKLVVEGTGKVSFDINTGQFDRKLHLEERLQLYRVIQELVSNALKHAHADKFDLKIEQTPTMSDVQFKDNGIGFDINKVKRGMGLQNIESRLNKIGATWTIASNWAGTTVIIQMKA